MSNTPRTDVLAQQFGLVMHPAVMAYNSLSRELERDNAALRSALVRTTGSLGLIIKGAGASAPGHKDNYDHARAVLAETDSDEGEDPMDGAPIR